MRTTWGILVSFLEELRRRNVFKVGAAYAIVAWLVIQVVNNFFPPLGLPRWSQTLVAVLILLGLPFALIFAWASELTHDEIGRRSATAPSAGTARPTGQTLNYIILGLVVLAVLFLGFDRFVLEPRATVVGALDMSA
jgi:hypothetical protein